jgi:hypothetical protein
MTCSTAISGLRPDSVDAHAPWHLWSGWEDLGDEETRQWVARVLDAA